MAFDSIPAILAEIRAGRMVVILDDEDRENEGDLIMAADRVRPEDVNFMAREARGLICLALTRERCAELGLAPMVPDNRSPYGTAFTVSIEAARGVTTGISAADRAHTIRTAVAPESGPADLRKPGHVFPLMAAPGGVLMRAGHTEAAVDLARLAGRTPAGVLVEIMNDDGTMARRPQLEEFARRHGLKIGTIADLIRHRLATEQTVQRVHEAAVDTELGPFRLVVYRDRIGQELHFALVRGEVDPSRPTLVRVQNDHFLADVLGIEGARYGHPVRRALRRIAEAGHGVVVVLGERHDPERILRQLGTSEPEPPARQAPAEWRFTGLGAQILVDLGVRRLRVLGTPRRFIGLSGFGLEVIEQIEGI
jgi:3,4-dihydroxy 2-butanone 4-phosphate synthase/GTP cyclohydrolase II